MRINYHIDCAAARAFWAVGMACIVAVVSQARSGIAWAQETVALVESNPASLQNVVPSAGESPGAVGDEFDNLLRMAEQDVSQLTQVPVSHRVPSMDTVVTTLSRSPSTIGKTPAAVFVITNDMIRRSGAMSIPEVLRMAPGVNVAKINSNTWAVSIRGFNGQYSNKLLVQIDGRSVYTPFFNGVVWSAQDVLLEDVDRIEVIRGPGGSIWQTNAVNGIINIITKPAAQTQGLFVQSGGGNVERGFTNLRYGGQIGQDIDYRFFGKWFERGTGVPSFGTPYDDWRAGHGGFRMDYDPGRTGENRFTVQGDALTNTDGWRELVPTTTPPFSSLNDSNRVFHNQNILARWIHQVDDEREWQLQTYYDYFQIDDQARSGLLDRRDTIDIDFQYHMPWGDYQKIVWGGGYRSYSDHDIFGGSFAGTTPAHQDIRFFTWFVQDEIQLVPDRWTATLGCKFLDNTYTNFEYQPSARLLFTPTDRQSTWWSVSRAVRIPSRFEETAVLATPPFFIGPGIPVFPQLRGSNALVAESVLAWEWGYRVAPTDAFSWDLATFFNQYENLIGVNAGGFAFAPPWGLVLPLNFANNNRAQSYGFELAANQEMTDCWKLRAAYSFLRVNMLGPATSDEGTAPTNQLYLQSSHTWDSGWELDLIGRYTDTLAFERVPAYFVGDVRLAWHYNPCTEFFLVGRNLFDNRHREFGPIAAENLVTGVRSEVYAGLSIRR